VGFSDIRRFAGGLFFRILDSVPAGTRRRKTLSGPLASMGPEKRDHPGVDKNTFIPFLIPKGLSDGGMKPVGIFRGGGTAPGAAVFPVDGFSDPRRTVDRPGPHAPANPLVETARAIIFGADNTAADSCAGGASRPDRKAG
jgi:hypothetical protein